MLGAFIMIWDYLDKGSYMCFCTFAILTLAAPLFFGGGFLLLIEIPILLAVFAVVNGKEFKARKRRIGAVIFAGAGLLIIPALAYYFQRNAPGIGLGVEQAVVPSFINTGRFILFGPYFGTFLRGLGLAPVFGTEEVYSVIPNSIALWFSLYREGIIFGIIVSLALFAYYACKAECRKESCLFWALGQVYMVLPFVFMSLAERASGGLFSSASLSHLSAARCFHNDCSAALRCLCKVGLCNKLLCCKESTESGRQ